MVKNIWTRKRNALSAGQCPNIVTFPRSKRVARFKPWDRIIRSNAFRASGPVSPVPSRASFCSWNVLCHIEHWTHALQPAIKWVGQRIVARKSNLRVIKSSIYIIQVYMFVINNLHRSVISYEPLIFPYFSNCNSLQIEERARLHLSEFSP